MHERDIGAKGEQLAAAYLTKKGYKILYNNWNCHWGELDIVALFLDKLIFAEVKYRKSNNFGSAYESFTFYKKKHLKRTIQIFLNGSIYKNSDWQFDLICIDDKKLTHYKNLNLN